MVHNQSSRVYVEEMKERNAFWHVVCLACRVAGADWEHPDAARQPLGCWGHQSEDTIPALRFSWWRNRHVDNGHWRQERRAQDAAWAPRGRGSLEQASEESRHGRGGGTCWSRPVALC